VVLPFFPGNVEGWGGEELAYTVVVVFVLVGEGGDVVKVTSIVLVGVVVMSG